MVTEEAVVIGCVVQGRPSQQQSMNSPDLVAFRVSVSFLQHKRRVERWAGAARDEEGKIDIGG